MSGELAPIQLDVAFRNFLFMRGQAVKDTRDILTELITNSVDAYRKIDGYQTMDKYIHVIFHMVPNQNSASGVDLYLQVVDNATGVEPQDMKRCFLSAGNKTASDTSRGFFSTGAKNITIFGDVHYTSITEDKLSKVYLDDMSYGHIVTYDKLNDDQTTVPDVVGVNIDMVQREILEIPSSGMNAVLIYTSQAEISKLNTLDKIDLMLESVKNIATLRDIFADPTYHVYRDIRSYAPHTNILDTAGFSTKIINTDYNDYDHVSHTDNFGGRYYKRIQYVYPVSALISDITFTVPDFPHYQARFIINKTDAPINQPLRENHMEFGFLIKDSLAIHEVNTLDDRFRWNPNINYMYGIVYCDGFSEELRRYDREETTELIIDPNRVSGINHDHPLYKSIMAVCLPRLDKAIRDVQSSTVFQSINIDELDTIVQELENAGVDIFDSSDITFNFVPDDEGELAVSLKETEQHIVKEVSNELNLRLITSDSPVLEDLNQKLAELGDGENYAFYYNENGDLQTIDVQKLSENDLQSLIDSIDSINAARPYIYRMDTGEWSRVEIYQRGKIDRLEDNKDSLIKVHHKSLTIQFINDINYNEKYIIDDTSGVTIKVNLHNEIVAEKLRKTKIDELETGGYAFKLSEEASYDALNFLEMVITSAFADIIVNNDIRNNRIMLDTDSVLASKKVLDHWNKIESSIDVKVHHLFSKFINQKKFKMMTEVQTSLETAKMELIKMFESGVATTENVEEGSERLAVAVENSIYNIINK